MTTAGSEVGYDTVISLRNTCGDINSELACNDDINDDNIYSQLEIEVAPSESPFLVVDSLNAGRVYSDGL